ncbi:hypothetical protein WAI99_22890, partial [Acinetobacter baumannii]
VRHTDYNPGASGGDATAVRRPYRPPAANRHTAEDAAAAGARGRAPAPDDGETSTAGPDRSAAGDSH